MVGHELALRRRARGRCSARSRRRAPAAARCRPRRSRRSAARPPASTATSASRMRRDRELALRGSCHQCGSLAARAVRRSTSSISVDLRAASRRRCRRGRRATRRRRRPSGSTSPASASARASLGRGSYSCGSELGVRISVTEARSPAMLRAMSASCVVVATTRGPPSPVSSSPDPQAARPVASAATQARARRERMLRDSIKNDSHEHEAFPTYAPDFRTLAS